MKWCHKFSVSIPRHNNDRIHVNISNLGGQIWGTHGVTGKSLPAADHTQSMKSNVHLLADQQENTGLGELTTKMVHQLQSLSFPKAFNT